MNVETHDPRHECLECDRNWTLRVAVGDAVLYLCDLCGEALRDELLKQYPPPPRPAPEPPSPIACMVLGCGRCGTPLRGEDGRQLLGHYDARHRCTTCWLAEGRAGTPGAPYYITPD